MEHQQIPQYQPMNPVVLDLMRLVDQVVEKDKEATNEKEVARRVVAEAN